MDVGRRIKGESIGMLSLVFLLKLIATLDAQVQSDDCPVNCIDRKCGDPYSNPPKKACTEGCLDGYWGNRCGNDCPSTCIKCHRNFGLDENKECYGCVDGYYLTETAKLCNLSCPSGCSICSSATNCTACKSGYYKINTECRSCLANCAKCSSGIDCTECKANFAGDTCGYCVDRKYGPSCDFNCPYHCRSCTSYSICQDCISGRYNYGSVTDCSLTSPPCPDNCKTCTSADDCQECNDGFYNTVSEKDCSKACPGRCAVCDSGISCSECKENYAGSVCQNCIDGKHGESCNNNCPAECKSCSSASICTECHDGYYSTASVQDCRYPCPDGCFACTSRTHCSSCKTNFQYESNVCQNCVDGKYGTNCDRQCLGKCLNSKCFGDTGYCISCLSDFKGDRCEQCVDGKYGVNCDQNCSQNCLSKTCTRYTRACTHGCINENFKYDTCTECKDGFYRTECTMPCPENCKSNACIQDDGLCSECKDGFYGTKCTQQCPANCNNGICDKGNGQCTHGCKGAYTGDHCDQCAADKYGVNCDLDCSIHCHNSVCERYNGTCTPCTFGYYGNKCDTTCSQHCSGQVCHQTTGDCSNGCQDGYSGDKCCAQSQYCVKCSSKEVCGECVVGRYGAECKTSCVDNCDDRGCDKVDGSCKGCQLHFYGQFCDLACSANCVHVSGESRCDAKTGNCVGDCDTGFHGDTCNKMCSGNCKDNACSKDGTACLQGCIPGYTGSACSEDDGDDGGPPVAAIAGGVAGGVVALLIVAFIVIFLKRRKGKQGKDDFVSDQADIHVPPEIVPKPSSTAHHKKTSKKEPPAPTETEENVEDEDDDPKVYENDNKEYINVGDIRKRVAVADLDKVVAEKPRQDFLDEYKLFPKGLVKPYNDSRLPQNLPMNRYASIYPYDENRVKIRGRPTDYVNASYIDGYKTNNAYIASLGPTKAAMDDFWLFWDMMWQEKVEKIVILTNLVENTNMKCEQYWPDANLTMTYGHVTVKNVHEEVNAEYTVRNFSVERDSETRVVSQVHFTAWPDKGVPDHVTSIVEFHEKVKSLKHELGGPILVHCSAGIGRTGTYIALDMITAEGEDKGYVDVFNCVMTLRYQRINMVQTSDQYIYLHKAVVHNLTYDSKPIPAAKFHDATSNTSVEEFEQKFKRLNTTMEKMTPEEEQAQRQSKTFSELNRKGADIPGNRHRPRLFRYQKMGDHDYINAVYLNSFKSKNHFIAAQTPLPATVEDFIKLILQEKCTVVVNLEPETLRIKSIGDYLPPDNQTVTHGQFKLSSNRLISPDAYSLRELLIQQEGNETETIVQCFQVNEWPAKDLVPKDHVTFLRFMKDVKEKARAMDTDDDGAAPILLHCLSGAQKCGLFCALHNCVEKMESEQEVSVGNIVRQIRFRRRTAFPNKDQLIFCYKAISAYLESLNTYSNFDLRL